MANYTFAKSMDTLNPGYAVGSGSTQSAIPYDFPGRRQFDTGPSNFDHQHRMTVSYVWQLPALARAIAPARYAFGNWQLTGILQAQSGAPLTVLAGQDQSGTGIGQDRGQYNGADPYIPGGCGATEAPCKPYLNSAAFVLPAKGSFGNAGKGALRGPGLFTWDLGLFKRFPIKERANLEFRLEYFNLLNHTNFLDPAATVSAAGFGGIRGANDPRIGQAAMKFTF